MVKNGISIKTVNNDILLGWSWECDNPKGSVVIATGMEEYALRYDDFATFLANNGYNVYCVDHYGQGDNCLDDSQFGIVPRSFFSKSVRNIDDIVKKFCKKGLPVTVFGHSMGSFIIQDYIQRFSKRPVKAVICGTDGPNSKATYAIGYPLARLVAKMKGETKPAKFLKGLAIGAYVKSVKHRKTDADWLSYNEENCKKYIEDPRCGVPSSNGFYREFLKGNNRLYKDKFLKKINPDLQILLIAGAEDAVGHNGKGPTKLAELYKKLGIKDVNLKIYPHMRHEILNEVDHQIVYQDVLDFLNK